MKFKLIIVAIAVVLTSCENSTVNPYAKVIEITNSYFDFQSINEGDYILIYSQNSGCPGCESVLKNEFEDFILADNIYVISNSRKADVDKAHIAFDSLDLLYTTDWGFSSPTIFVKKDNNLECFLEVNAQNIDSLYDFITNLNLQSN